MTTIRRFALLLALLAAGSILAMGPAAGVARGGAGRRIVSGRNQRR